MRLLSRQECIRIMKLSNFEVMEIAIEEVTLAHLQIVR